MISLSELFMLAGLIGFVTFAWQSVAAKEQALAVVKKHCQGLDLQLIDQTVALRAIWLKRNVNGQLSFWRSYRFEFSSTGFERYHGQLVLLGKRVEGIELEPYIIEREDAEG